MYDNFISREFQERFKEFEELLDDMLLGVYYNLSWFKDRELIDEAAHLIETEDGVKRLGDLYRKVYGFDVKEPPVYSKLIARIDSVRKHLTKEWRARERKKF